MNPMLVAGAWFLLGAVVAWIVTMSLCDDSPKRRRRIVHAAVFSLFVPEAGNWWRMIHPADEEGYVRLTDEYLQGLVEWWSEQ